MEIDPFPDLSDPYDIGHNCFPCIAIPRRPLGSSVAATLDEPELLRYRSNLLGSDLRITNFAGGNTSSKVDEIDPLTGRIRWKVLWVKGSRRRPGQHQAHRLCHALPGEAAGARTISTRAWNTKTTMVAMYPLCTFRNNPVAASIDTPLHGFLPFPHVDHLHPDWGIALAASRQRQSQDGGVQSRVRSLAGVDSVAAAGL